MLAAGMLTPQASRGGTPSSNASLAPDPVSTLITSYNALEDGRWIEAWRGFHSTANRARQDLLAIRQRVSNSQPTGMRAALTMAHILARLELPREAIEVLDKQIAAQPASTLPFDLKAMVLAHSNRLTEAMGVLRAAPQGASGAAHNSLLQAYVLLRQGEWDESRRLLDANWPMLDSCFLAWNMRGFLGVVQGRHGEALKDFERALELNPDFAPARENLLFAGLMRTKGVFGLSATNLDVQAKGLFGASATFDLKSKYDQKTGFGISFDAQGSFDSGNLTSRSGLFARTDVTLEDARQGNRADLQSILGGNEHAAPEAVPVGPAIAPELTCPLLIWN